MKKLEENKEKRKVKEEVKKPKTILKNQDLMQVIQEDSDKKIEELRQ